MDTAIIPAATFHLQVELALWGRMACGQIVFCQLAEDTLPILSWKGTEVRDEVTLILEIH